MGSASKDAEGQCAGEKELPFGFKISSYKFCCEYGTACDCAAPPVAVEEKAAVAEEKPVAVAVEEKQVAVTSEVGNCAVLPYDFCCEVGTKCDCSASKDAEGQCAGEKELAFGFKISSYKFCCDYGTACDCAAPPVVVEEKAVAVVEEEKPLPVTSEVGNCAVLPYDFCCEVGTKCDCSASKDAEGQCAGEKELAFGFKISSYKFCCDYGTACDCAAPPVMEAQV